MRNPHYGLLCLTLLLSLSPALGAVENVDVYNVDGEIYISDEARQNPVSHRCNHTTSHSLLSPLTEFSTPITPGECERGRIPARGWSNQRTDNGTVFGAH